jgi:hypothetical protein
LGFDTRNAPFQRRDSTLDSRMGFGLYS